MSYKIKFSIYLIVFLVLNLALVFFLRNSFLEIKKTSLEIISKRSETLLLEKKAQSSQDFADLFGKEKEKFNKVESLFIDPEMPVEFINFLEKTAKDQNLSIDLSISPSPIGKDLWPAIGFQINLAGFSPDVFKFLEKLSHSRYLIDIQSLEISKIEKEKTPIGKEILAGNIKAGLLIKVYNRE